METNPTARMNLDSVIVDLTEAEVEEIRDTIKRWSFHFRKKLNTEIQVRELNKKKKG